MKFIIIGKNIDVTTGLREAVESKLGKLERYFTPDTENSCNIKCAKGAAENRSNDSSQRYDHPLRTSQR